MPTIKTLVCDDAGQFKLLTERLALWWIHAGRHYEKLSPMVVDSVTYRYKPKTSRMTQTCTVSGDQFVKGFAHHILPTGFRKVRYFGWLASNSRTKLEELRIVVWFALGWVYWLATAHAPQPMLNPFPKVRCSACGAEMKVIGITYDPILPTLGSHSLAYLDTG